MKLKKLVANASVGNMFKSKLRFLYMVKILFYATLNDIISIMNTKFKTCYS